MTDKGWICPKCGRVYAPYVPECAPCNQSVGKPLVADDMPRGLSIGVMPAASYFLNALRKDRP